MSDRPVSSEPLTMTNDEAQDWLLGLLNASPPPRDAARFGAAIRAIRAKAIADAKEWFAPDEAARSATPSSEEDGRTTAVYRAIERIVENELTGVPHWRMDLTRRLTDAALAATPDNAGRSPIDVDVLAAAIEDVSQVAIANGHDWIIRTDAFYRLARLSESTGSASPEEPDR